MGGTPSSFPPPPPPPATAQSSAQSGYPGAAYPGAGPNSFPPPSAGYGAALPAGMKPHRATTDIVLGILGLLCCGILAIPAFIMSKNDIAEMDAGRMDPSGRGTTNVARILGIIGIVLLAINLVVGLGLLVTGGFTASTS